MQGCVWALGGVARQLRWPCCPACCPRPPQRAHTSRPRGVVQGDAIELATRVAVLLLRLHHLQLVATASARPLLLKLHKALHPAVQVRARVLRAACCSRDCALQSRGRADPLLPPHPLLTPRSHARAQSLKDVLGVNMAALQHLSRAAADRSGVSQEERVRHAKAAMALP